MKLPRIKESTYNYLLNRLSDKFPSLSKVDSITELSGGSINEAYSLNTNAGRFFVKINSVSLYPGMFEAEAKGLKMLGQTKAIRVPEVLLTANTAEETILVLPFIGQGKVPSDLGLTFGKELAALHKNTNTYFGLDHPNYIGSLKQSNSYHDNWPDFFIQERIEPQFKMAFDTGHFQSSDQRKLYNIFKRLGDLVPGEKPALVHGDLWSGNYLVNDMGKAVLIDPAVYYGHREMDIAMMHLFGGFPQGIYESYNEIFPLEKEWEQRIDLHNLYPVLVHVNLFGGGYLQQARSIVDRYC